VLTEAEYSGEYGGEARVMLNSAENRKSSFKELNPNSYLSKLGSGHSGGKDGPVGVVMLVEKVKIIPPWRQVGLE
jgi:hypothetical protein